LIYGAIYLGFVLINAFFPSAMEATPFAGISLAVSYGMGLIVSAFVLAMIYGLMCKPENADSERGPSR
jgi:uncharacterized membrane protein (DUF485 family)